ncbi:MAG: hypothetical protein GAK28_02410 [Luteibacter sp.]|uniref:hypothetical protein n=1 Tax=Luteibacter sp. TaxID=1886636 RepID=UPI0013802180|nr:hypothetical protein [Luteibacter sp.]KAF1006734.1 MAG: hypothetical protein GAK28_02410 [Luteibacter sp.]
MTHLPFFLGGLYLGGIIVWAAMMRWAITRQGELIDKLQSSREDVARLKLLMKLNGYDEHSPKDRAGGGV